ncbi:MAG: GDSL-type esterase/lipase family protein [Desulfovibrio sp.]|jgi:lysophospholipase L1-like esterase|nr:GDSL-type esterase/lipase family protein [Desulfovibrio sp.]
MLVIFLGDSLTWRFDWEGAFSGAPVLQVRNRGMDGDTTGGVLSRLARIIAARPDLLFLQIGINDLLSFCQPPDEEELLPLFDRHREIQRRLLNSLPALKLHVCSLIPVSLRFDASGGFNASIRAFNAMLEKEAREKEVPYIDLYTPLSDEKGGLARQFDEDGVHLLPAAYKVWSAIVRPHIMGFFR